MRSIDDFCCGMRVPNGGINKRELQKKALEHISADYSIYERYYILINHLSKHESGLLNCYCMRIFNILD